MWQRIQTVFLSLVVLCCLLFLFLPIWTGGDVSTSTVQQLFPLHYTVTTDEVRTTQYYPYAITAVLAVASATLAVISIRAFGNRMAQLKMGALNSVLLAGTMLASVFFAKQMLEQYRGHLSYFSLGLLMASVLLNFLANRFIRRDEKIVRNADRLR